MRAVLTSKGQITIPARLRQRLRLKPGSVLEFDEEAGYLKARPVIDEKKARAVLGCAKDALPGYTAEQWLSKTRGRRVRLAR